MTTGWWVSCWKFTVRVSTDEHEIIVEAAPIVRKFVGQPLGNLLRWAEKFGGVECCYLGPRLGVRREEGVRR